MLPLTITRSIDLDAPADAVWDAIGDPRGLEHWLAGSLDLEPEPGRAGTLVEPDGTRRRVVVTERLDGERLGFVWWDEDRPDDASVVRIEVDATDAGTRVTVTETAAPAAIASAAGAGSARLGPATVHDLVGMASAWEARLDRLVGVAAGSLMAVGA